jgi:hypothetical protein
VNSEPLTLEALNAEIGPKEFWESREQLALIRDWARARRAAPYATLAETLARITCRVSPAVQLPPLVGGNGTLNMLFAVTGDSGVGKGASSGAAEAAAQWADETIPMLIPTVPIGSGEGIAKTFGSGRSKDGIQTVNRICYSALFTVREIDTFTALKNRSSSTISGQLRHVYSGEEIGFGYGDADKRVIIPAHQYRACLIAGVQPGRGETLLEDADGGLPQRFAWFPTTDSEAPDQQPDTPEMITWKKPSEITRVMMSDTKPTLLPVCEQARSTIDSERVKRLRGESGGLDGHSLYTRLKLAAALGLFHGHFAVTEEDWQLAGHLMFVSDMTRDMVADTLKANKARRSEAQGHAEAARDAVRESEMERRMVSKVTDRIIGVLLKTGDWVSASDLRRALRAELRQYFDDAITALKGSGRIEAAGATGANGVTGSRYRLATPTES